MKTIQTIKHLWPFHPQATSKAESKAGTKVQEAVLGSICFLLFLALGPFAAIPTFLATFSIPKWLEEERGENR